MPNDATATDAPADKGNTYTTHYFHGFHGRGQTLAGVDENNQQDVADACQGWDAGYSDYLRDGFYGERADRARMV